MEVEWRKCRGFERYEVSTTGVVRVANSGREVKQRLSRWGYPMLTLHSMEKHRTVEVHRLVAETFIERPSIDSLTVNHIDGNKRNNNLCNLEWVTRGDNQRHAYRLGLRRPPARLNWDQVRSARQRYADGERIANIARDLGVVRSTIEWIVKDGNQQHWKEGPA